MATAAALRETSLLRWTSWKNPSSARSGANWSRPAWPAPATRRLCSRSYAAPPKLAATIPAPAARARNTRSAAAPRVKCHPEQRFASEAAAQRVAPASRRLSRGHPALASGGGTPPRQPPGRRRYGKPTVEIVWVGQECPTHTPCFTPEARRLPGRRVRRARDSRRIRGRGGKSGQPRSRWRKASACPSRCRWKEPRAAIPGMPPARSS